MTDLEDVTQHLDALKTAPASEFHLHFSRALRRFRFIPHAERRACADAFGEWAASTTPVDPDRMRAYARFLQGMDRFIAEEFRAALDLLSQSRAVFTARDDREGLGLTAMLIGATYRTFGNFDLALKVLFESLELLRASARYPIFLAATANSLGNIELELGHLDDALEMFRLGFEQSTLADDFYFGVYTLHGLGRVYARTGRDAEAAEAFRRALELAERHEHPLHIANSLTELAAFHFRAGRLDEAESMSEQALELRERHRLMAGAVTNCLRLAEIHVQRGQFDAAKRRLERALTIAEALGVTLKVAQVHFQLANFYERTRDLKQSLYHFKRFHELREEVEREDKARSIADAKAMFEAEQARKENVVIKQQKAEIELKNHELQDTIDELTRARIGRKAKAMTLGLMIVLFIFQDAILRTALRLLASDNYFFLLAVKMAIIFSLSPINKAIEHRLLKRVMKRDRRPAIVAEAVAA